MTPTFHPLAITQIRPQTTAAPHAAAIRFAVPETLRETFRFLPGQYLTLRATIDGQDVRRSYSICTPDNAAHLEVGIRAVEGGTFSNHVLALQPGDTLDVMAPQGRFTAPVGGTHRYLLVAAGSGITPCLSIAASVLDGEPDSRITLVYGNRSVETVMFRLEIDALKDRYPDRLSLFHVLSRETQDVEWLNGRIDGERIRTLASRSLIDVDELDAAYLCGPQAMIEDVTEALRDLGMPEDAIRFELFGTAPAATRTTAPPVHTGTQVRIIVDGSTKRVPIDPAAQTVLQAAQAAGLDLPFSCAGGMCCTCRAKVVEGEAAMDANYSLEPWEVEAGFTLACQARPTGETLAIDFDAV